MKFGVPSQNWVDGGARHNNPVREVLDEANRIWRKDSSNKVTCVVSIGAGEPPPKNFGSKGKDILETLVQISLDTKQTEREFRREISSLPAELQLTYIRLNAQSITSIGLEEWKHFDNLTGVTNDYLNDSDPLIDQCANLLNMTGASTYP